jgi:hypothetical protein
VDKTSIDSEKQKLLSDYRETFTSRAGKEVLFDLLKRSGIMENNFHENERLDCYAAGRKSLGFEILELMNYASIKGYFELKQEQVAKQLANKSIVERYFPGDRNAR